MINFLNPAYYLGSGHAIRVGITLRKGRSKAEQVYKRVRTWRFRGKPEWRRLDLGFEMQIDSADPMDVDFYLGCYQQELLRLIRILVSTGDTVIDVGAQKGFISLILSKQVGLHGCVISIEPDPRAMQFLTTHIQRNRCGNVITFNYGLGATVESCAFALSAQLGWSSRYPNEAAQQCVTSIAQIPIRTLDDVMEELDSGTSSRKITFIKIDAEGSEPDIVSGGVKTISRHRPALYLEVNKRSLAMRGGQTDSAEALLRHLGYKFFWVGKHSLGSLGSSVRLQSLNYLTERREDLYDVLAIAPDTPLFCRATRFMR